MDAPADHHHRAEGVAYFTIEDFHKAMFRCEPWRASLTAEACAKRWHQAQAARGMEAEGLERCRSCLIGAQHAGEAAVYRSPHFGSNVCPRCERGTARRLIGNRLCISCYNRSREVVVGENARGKKPTKLQLKRLRLGVVLNHGSADARLVAYEDWAVDLQELARQVLRTTEGQLSFMEAPANAPAWSPPRLTRAPRAPRCVKSAYL